MKRSVTFCFTELFDDPIVSVIVRAYVAYKAISNKNIFKCMYDTDCIMHNL